MQNFSYLQSYNAEYIDELHEKYLADPSSVDDSWRYFFDGIELGTQQARSLQEIPPASRPAKESGYAAPVIELVQPARTPVQDFSGEAKIFNLINAYRQYGHLLADLNPLGPPAGSHPSLELGKYGLSEADLGRRFAAGRTIGLGEASLGDIVAHLRKTYCGKIGVEFTQIQDTAEREWLQQKMESRGNQPGLDAETRKFIYRRLTESETFERFLHTRYVAQKRFSVEGGESLIPSLDSIIETATRLGTRDFVIGMAHRGRLNVLANIMGKKPEYILTEFEGAYDTTRIVGEGDVKYHMGFSNEIKTRFGEQVHVALAFNPSHLEFIDPVVNGMARAKQDASGKDRLRVLPIQVHGDAAFAGQGVVYETLNLSQLEGFKTGGTLHVVVNNQVGFTADPQDLRSTTYCTDLAKMLNAPVFHVNGDDPEAVWYVSWLCTEYRQKFQKDSFIDLVCYRKHGHNEGDEPSFTQPLMYKKIKSHPSTRELYGRTLVEAGALPQQAIQAEVDQVLERLSQAQARTREEKPQPFVSSLEGNWKRFRLASEQELLSVRARTAVAKTTLLEIAQAINVMPGGFHLHPKLTRFFEARLKSVQEGKGIDWGNAEALAFGSLLLEGHPVRLTGQDAERGTFTHRHSVLNDFETGSTYAPLNHIRPGKQAEYSVYNSHLSEIGVLAFEYGFSLADPNTLAIWEAQFGDFANGAQVIIDQFLSASESKWQRMSGLTLLLPHGYEGQGPEHSSARLERFLSLSGLGNWQVCNITTPANFFHALRRQLKRDFRKPLVVMSPKSLLRHPMAVSTLEELASGGFHEVLDDPQAAPAPGKVSRLLLCSGKIYYDLITQRANLKRDDVAVIRLEQLYPWPAQELARVLATYENAREIVWVQEEPRNMGAWSHVCGLWSGCISNFQQSAGNRGIRYCGRDIAAAPAVGSAKLHDKQQKALVAEAFR